MSTSDLETSAVLQQEDSKSIDHSVCYYSKKFDEHQKKYFTIEKETPALLLALHHFDVYLSGTLKPVLVFTDHNPLVFLHKMRDQNQRAKHFKSITCRFVTSEEKIMWLHQ